MLKLKLSLCLSSFLFLAGCGGPVFTPTPLVLAARGITTVQQTPYNCKVLGEIEGIEEVRVGYEGANMQNIRAGAVNDLKNNAVQVVGANKRATLRIVGEQSLCQGHGGLVDCGMAQYKVVRAYKIQAQVFDCGDK